MEIPTTDDGRLDTARLPGRQSGLRTQFPEINAEHFTEWANVSGGLVCAASEVALSTAPRSHAGPAQINLKGLSNAFLRGQACPSFRMKSHGHPADAEQFIARMGSLGHLFRSLMSMDWEDHPRYSGYAKNVLFAEGIAWDVYREDGKGIRTFSAAHLDQVKPLTSIPKKWTVRLAMRAVLTGQVEQWFVDGVYTDDYARDAANNFRRGELENYLSKARKIWESPSGWKVWPENEGRTELSFNCHSFDTNTINVDLDAEAIDTEFLTGLRREQSS